MKDPETATTSQETERGTWGSGLEFLMSCIAMSVGLGNVWRFPFIAYQNGGGAFLIPYLIVLFLMGRPVYYMEMCLGQFSSRANVKMFEALAPALKGVGYGQLIGTICVATYYCSLMAITLFYLINSFTKNLPWSECNSNWKNHEYLGNLTCIPSNSVDNSEQNNTMSSSEMWFRIEVLKEYENIDHGIGLPEWRLTLCLLVSWLITFAVCAKGVQSSGKASYFLALFPYVILAAIFIRAVTLEGATTGIIYFFNPRWEKLTDAKVWYSAVTQCFFSLNIGFGSVVMYASYNSFEHNINRDALVVSLLDTFTSMLAGTIIFGILGNLAHKMDVDVSDVVKSGGTGLAFISYPEAIAKFDAVPWLFAILFFFMLFVLGVGCLVALQACAFTVIIDTFPNLKIWHVSLGTAIGGFLVGLVYITPGGQYIFAMIDFFGGTFIFFVLTTVEVIAVLWWYGLENFCIDIHFMLKKTVNAYWRISWGLFTPVVLILVFIYFVSTLERIDYEGKPYPNIVLAFGWAVLGFGVIQPILWWLHFIYRKRKLGFVEAAKASFSHSNWGPQDPKKYEEWKEFKLKAEEKRIAKGRSHFKHMLLVVFLGKD